MPCEFTAALWHIVMTINAVGVGAVSFGAMGFGAVGVSAPAVTLQEGTIHV